MVKVDMEKIGILNTSHATSDGHFFEFTVSQNIFFSTAQSCTNLSKDTDLIGKNTK